jgi:hypothetical protein
MSNPEWATLALCGCLMATACGGSTESTTLPAGGTQASSRSAGASVAQRRSACELITADEASAIVGSPLVATERSKESTSSSCYFAPTGRDTQEFVLKVTWSGGREAWQAQEEAAALSGRLMGGDRSPANTVMASEAAGVGDKSSYNPIIGAYVLKGDVLLEFNNLLTLRDPKSTWETLARKALERL